MLSATAGGELRIDITSPFRRIERFLGSFSEVLLADLFGELFFRNFGCSLRILDLLGKPAKLKHVSQDLSNNKVITTTSFTQRLY